MIKIHFSDGHSQNFKYVGDNEKGFKSQLELHSYMHRDYTSAKFPIPSHYIKYIEWIDETDSPKDK